MSLTYLQVLAYLSLVTRDITESDLSNDLLNDQIFRGDVHSISGIAVMVYQVVRWVLSLGGLFIIVLPQIRLVFNGIYCTASGLCDAIDEIKKADIKLKMPGELGLKTLQQATNTPADLATKYGTPIVLLLSLMPNFKELSDFKDDTPDPKTFLFKAVPAMAVYMFIGAFLFNGRHVTLTNKVVTVGDRLLTLAVNNVDVDAVVDGVASTTKTFASKAKFSSDGSSTIDGKNINNFAKILNDRLYGVYKASMSVDNKQTIAPECERFAQGIFESEESLKGFAVNDDYKIGIKISVVPQQPNHLSSSKVAILKGTNKDTDTSTYEFMAPVTDVAPSIQIPEGNKDNWVTGVIVAKKSVKPHMLRLEGALTGFSVGTLGSGKIQITFPEVEGVDKQTFKIEVGNKTYSAETLKGNTVEFDIGSKNRSSVMSKLNEGLTKIRGSVFVRDSKGRRHQVTHIKCDKSKNVMFIPSDKEFEPFPPGGEAVSKNSAEGKSGD